MGIYLEIGVSVFSLSGGFRGVRRIFGGGVPRGGGGVPRSAIGPNSVCFVESSIFTAFV